MPPDDVAQIWLRESDASRNRHPHFRRHPVTPSPPSPSPHLRYMTAFTADCALPFRRASSPPRNR
ncbi:MAG: hypothetical protein OD918_10625 [Gammaproteobacteria bacterium]